MDRCSATALNTFSSTRWRHTAIERLCFLLPSLPSGYKRRGKSFEAVELEVPACKDMRLRAKESNWGIGIIKCRSVQTWPVLFGKRKLTRYKTKTNKWKFIRRQRIFFVSTGDDRVITSPGLTRFFFFFFWNYGRVNNWLNFTAFDPIRLEGQIIFKCGICDLKFCGCSRKTVIELSISLWLLPSTSYTVGLFIV
jgi:hypothetical protein